MTDSLAVASGVLRPSCGTDLRALPLHTVLTGIWHVILWAANSACTVNIGASPTRVLGMHVGTAAVFLVADKLLCCRVGRRIEAALHVSLEALVAWLFPADKQFGRRADGALRALAGLLAANGLLLLKNRARTQQAHQVGRLLTAGQRAIFCQHSFPWIPLEERQRGVSELVHLQLLAVRAPDISLEHYGTQLADASVLYQWLGPSRYVGVAGVQRPSRPMTPGPAQRWWEHLLHRCRPNLKGASLKKYGLFRKADVSLQGFLVCRAGPSTMMNAGELLEVRCHRPPANTHPKSKLRHHNVARARPPRSCRGYTKHQVREGTFEGIFGSRQFDIALGRAKKAQAFHSNQRQRQDPVQSLRMNFKTAYRHVQQVRRAQNNLAGPLNVYCRTHWRLALLCFSTPGSELCWATMDKHWRSSCAALLLWKKAGFWLNYRRRLLVQQRIDFLLRERGLPTTQGVTVKVPNKAFIPAIRQAVDLAVQRHPGLDSFLQHYVRRQSRLVVGKQRCFSDLQNCSARAVDFQWSKVADCSDDFLVAAITGTAAERVEHNWQFPIRTQRHEDVEVVKNVFEDGPSNCAGHMVPGHFLTVQPVFWDAAGLGIGHMTHGTMGRQTMTASLHLCIEQKQRFSAQTTSRNNSSGECLCAFTSSCWRGSWWFPLHGVMLAWHWKRPTLGALLCWWTLSRRPYKGSLASHPRAGSSLIAMAASRTSASVAAGASVPKLGIHVWDALCPMWSGLLVGLGGVLAVLSVSSSALHCLRMRFGLWRIQGKWWSIDLAVFFPLVKWAFVTAVVGLVWTYRA